MERNKMNSYFDEPAAFPIVVDGYVQEGMTLRDYFAAMAMQGFLATDDYSVCSDITLAVDSYKIADAMIKAREKD
jgi:hypothetical protein